MWTKTLALLSRHVGVQDSEGLVDLGEYQHTSLAIDKKLEKEEVRRYKRALRGTTRKPEASLIDAVHNEKSRQMRKQMRQDRLKNRGMLGARGSGMEAGDVRDDGVGV
jgi:hypothetical protein